MAAAIAADSLGMSTVVLDEQHAPGGQVFRSVETAHRDPALSGEFVQSGAKLVGEFRDATRIEYRPSTTLWHLDPDTGLLSTLSGDATAEIRARRVLLATGAQERPVPIPGWTLPGVMSAGAAQILLKTAGAVPSGEVVIAGQGPLAWLVAVQLLRAGSGPVTLLETGAEGALWDAVRAGGLWTGKRMLAKGIGLVREAKRLNLRIVRNARNIRAEGLGRVRSVAWDGGTLPCDLLLLHQGVIPSTHISCALGLKHEWDDQQFCWRPKLDSWGATSHPNVAIAGDGGGIGGWQVAACTGELAALDAASRHGFLSEAERGWRAVRIRREMRRSLALRLFLDRLYAPPSEILAPPEEATIVCRCEEITAGEIRAVARQGATGPNQVKSYVRAGMGACQGRMCGTTVAALVAQERAASIEETGFLRPRSPYKPLTVGQLAMADCGVMPSLSGV